MNQYTVGQTLYRAEFGYRRELEITRAVVDKVTAKTVTLVRHTDGGRGVNGRYLLDAETGFIALCRYYPPAYPTPAAALRALLADLQAKEVSLQESLRTTQHQLELVVKKLEEETAK